MAEPSKEELLARIAELERQAGLRLGRAEKEKADKTGKAVSQALKKAEAAKNLRVKAEQSERICLSFVRRRGSLDG